MEFVDNSIDVEGGTDPESATAAPKETSQSGASAKAMAVLAGMGGAAVAGAQVGPRGEAKDPPPAPAMVNDPLYLLVQRITFGFTEEEYATAVQMGFTGYLEWQLNYESIDDSAMDARLATFDYLPMKPYQLLKYQQTTSAMLTQLQDATLLRAVFSRRQLYEKMVEFWSDHFSTDMNKTASFKVVEDRTVQRTYAMSTFSQILLADMRSPNMLIYLDNQTSNATTPNQNYAREYLELHTLGVDNGYTQNDVNEVAKCFSGWSYNSDSRTKQWGVFQFISSRHNNGAKTVMGTSIPAGGGINDGLTVHGIVANHPNTAEFVSRKLVRRFLTDDPPQELVDSIAAVFMATGGSIKDVLRAILTPANLTNFAQPRLKRPFHIVASMLRASKATVTNIAAAKNLLNGMGHLPFRWAPPNGYPDVTGYWSQLLLPRWNVGFSLMNGNVSGSTVNATALFQGLTTNTAIANRINQLLFGGRMAPEDLAAVTAYMSATETDINKIREALALGMSSPSFQWY